MIICSMATFGFIMHKYCMKMFLESNSKLGDLLYIIYKLRSLVKLISSEDTRLQQKLLANSFSIWISKH